MKKIIDTPLVASVEELAEKLSGLRPGIESVAIPGRADKPPRLFEVDRRVTNAHLIGLFGRSFLESTAHLNVTEEVRARVRRSLALAQDDPQEASARIAALAREIRQMVGQAESLSLSGHADTKEVATGHGFSYAPPSQRSFVSSPVGTTDLPGEDHQTAFDRERSLDTLREISEMVGMLADSCKVAKNSIILHDAWEDRSKLRFFPYVLMEIPAPASIRILIPTLARGAAVFLDQRDEWHLEDYENASSGLQDVGLTKVVRTYTPHPWTDDLRSYLEGKFRSEEYFAGCQALMAKSEYVPIWAFLCAHTGKEASYARSLGLNPLVLGWLTGRRGQDWNKDSLWAEDKERHKVLRALLPDTAHREALDLLYQWHTSEEPLRALIRDVFPTKKAFAMAFGRETDRISMELLDHVGANGGRYAIMKMALESFAKVKSTRITYYDVVGIFLPQFASLPSSKKRRERVYLQLLDRIYGEGETNALTAPTKRIVDLVLLRQEEVKKQLCGLWSDQHTLTSYLDSPRAATQRIKLELRDERTINVTLGLCARSVIGVTNTNSLALQTIDQRVRLAVESGVSKEKIGAALLSLLERAPATGRRRPTIRKAAEAYSIKLEPITEVPKENQ